MAFVAPQCTTSKWFAMWKVLQQIRYPAYKRMAARVRKIAKKEDGNESEWIPSCHISKMVKHSMCVCVCKRSYDGCAWCVCIWKPNCGEIKHTQIERERYISAKVEAKYKCMLKKNCSTLNLFHVNDRKKRNNSIKYEFNRKKAKEWIKREEKRIEKW